MDGIAEQAAEIAETAAEIAEEAAEAASEEETPAASDTAGIAEAIHDVALQDQINECLQRLTLVEMQLQAAANTAVEAEQEAEQAQATANLAVDVAFQALEEAQPPLEQSSIVEEIQPEPSPQTQETKPSLWESLLSL